MGYVTHALVTNREAGVVRLEIPRVIPLTLPTVCPKVKKMYQRDSSMFVSKLCLFSNK